MDTLNKYREILVRVLTPYAERNYSDKEIINEAVFDVVHDRYLVVSVGWQGIRRVQHCLLHLDIINGKIWIQRDGTEDGIADELEAAGIPKSNIVLAFHPEKDRTLIGEYAVA
jgi:soluble P-type ATPase